MLLIISAFQAVPDFILLLLSISSSNTLFQAKGDAEAFAINERAKADAEVMKQKAAAWKDYKGTRDKAIFGWLRIITVL